MKKYKIIKTKNDQNFTCRIGSNKSILRELAKYWNKLKDGFKYSIVEETK